MYLQFNKILSAILILLITCSFSFAQRRNKRANFENDSLTKNIPTEFQAYPAVIIYKKKHVIISNNNTSDVTRFRCKILSKSGLDLFSVVEVVKTKEQKLVKAFARTLKQNGKIVNLDVNDIKYTDIEMTHGEKPNLELMKFIIPNVEVGDEIEYVVEMSTPDIIPGIDYYFHSFIPSIYSSFKMEIRNSTKMDRLIKNGINDAKIIYDYGDLIYLWEFQNLPALRLDENYNTIINQIPSISLAIRKSIRNGEMEVINPNKWDDIYVKIKKDYSNMNFTKDFNNYNINKWLDEKIKKYSNTDKTIIIKNIVQFLYDSIEVIKSDDVIKNKPGFQLIYEKKIDENNYFNLVNLLFEKLQINYYIGCAANKYSGFISENFPSLHNITNKFLLFESNNNQLHYIHLPLYGSQFRFDELPYTILGTYSMIIKETEKSEKYQVVKFMIPYSTYTENTRTTKINIKHSINNQSSRVKVEESFTGDFNTMFNSTLNHIINKDSSKKTFIEFWNLKIDDLDSLSYKQNSIFYPFNSTLKYSYSNNSYINEIGDNLYSLNIEDLIQHFIIETSNYERFADFHLPFPFQDNFEIVIQFDKNIKLETVINSMNSNYNIADYDITIKQLSKDKIVINSNYSYESAELMANSSDKMHQMNNDYFTAKSRKIIFNTIAAKNLSTPKKVKSK